MATKKSPRKKKKTTSPRNIILLIIATVLGALIVWVTINAVRQQQLEREDREKFAVLEAKMGEVKAKFEQASLGVSWEQVKSCNRMSTPFPSDEGIGCSIEVISAGEVDLAQIEQLRRELTVAGFDEGKTVTSSEDEKTLITDYNPGIKDVYCSLLVNDADENNQGMKPVFYCRTASSKIVYPLQ